jgi:hypothetical protein
LIFNASIPYLSMPSATNEVFIWLDLIIKIFPDAVIFPGSARLMKVKQAS